jgi:hypothetical protein
MAFVVGISPDQLTKAGRAEAAEILREMNRQRASTLKPVDPRVAEIRGSRIFTAEEKAHLIKALPPRKENGPHQQSDAV